MQLRYAPTSPFARKVRIVIRECGLADQVEEISVDPWNDASLRGENPLGKVPALRLADGAVLYDSPVISEFLDAESVGRHVFPARGPQRWRSLRRQALGDGLAEAIIRRFVERRRPPQQQSETVIARQTETIEAALDVLDAEAPSLLDPPTIGEIAIACALGYYDFREPEAGWRRSRPELARWYAVFDRRPAMQQTRHHAG